MRVLLVAYYFHPDREVGALRSGRIARILADRGYQVHVLAGPSAHGEGEAGYPDVTVERLRPLLDPRRTYASLKNRLRNGGNAPEGPTVPSASNWTPPQRVPTWKRHSNAVLWLPDDRQGWMVAAIRRGRALAAEYRFDLVYSTAPPFSALLAGLAIRRFARPARWIVEFRDPWTDNPVKPEFVRTRWSDWADRKLEKACLDRADHVVCVTESTASLLRERLGPLGGKVEVIRNGMDGAATPSTPEGPGNGSILYVGNLYHSRDPRPFLEGLADLHAGGDLPEGTSADFVGDCGHFRGMDIRSYAEELGISELVRFHGSVAHDVCLDMMRRASVLLLLAQNQPLQVPNKLYEYVSAGRPILAFADPGGETSRLLGEAGGHVVLDGSAPGDVGQAILSSLRAKPDPDGRRQALLEEWSTAGSFNRLIESIERSTPIGMG